MPIPKPGAKESKKNFISRCMGNDTMVKEYEPDKRRAICETSWDDTRKDSNKKSQFQSVSINHSVMFRQELIDGNTVFVAPVVAVKEMVLKGELLPAEEIATFAGAWNGRPLTVSHPLDPIGMPTTANTPELEPTHVGKFYHVGYDPEEKALKGELYLDMVKAQRTEEGREILELLRKGKPLEVSTGYFAETELVSGTFNGEEYDGIQRNLRPDHLALLPEEVGACSWEDGCGAGRVSVNVLSKETFLMNIKDAIKVLVRALGFDDENLVIEERDQGKTVANGAKLQLLLDKMINDQVTKDRTKNKILGQLGSSAGVDRAKIEQILNGEVDFMPFRWVEAFGATLGIDPFEIMMAALDDQKDFLSQGGGKDDEDDEKCNKNDEKVASSPEKVENKVDDKVLEDSKQEEVVMSNVDKVTALIANDKTEFAEDDREWLESLEEEMLDKLEPPCAKAVVEEPEANSEEEEVVESEEVVEEEPEANAEEKEEETSEKEAVSNSEEETIEDPPAESLTVEDHINSIKDEAVRELLTEAVGKLEANRKAAISEIVDNSDFKAEELEDKTLEELEKLRKLSKKSEGTDYSGQGVPVSHNTLSQKGSGVPSPPPVVLAKREDK